MSKYRILLVMRAFLASDTTKLLASANVQPQSLTNVNGSLSDTICRVIDIPIFIIKSIKINTDNKAFNGWLIV